MGFIGSVLLILLFLFLIFHLIRLASKIDNQFNKVFIYYRICIVEFNDWLGVVLSIYYHEPQRYQIPALSKNLIQFNLYKRDTIHIEQCLSFYINLDNQYIKYYIIMQIILIHDLLD